MDKVILLAAAIITDQLSKYLALLLLPPGESFSFMGNILELTFVFNPDGFLSMARGLPGPVRFFLLNICVGGLLAVTLYYLFFYGGRKKHYELPLPKGSSTSSVSALAPTEPGYLTLRTYIYSRDLLL